MAVRKDFHSYLSTRRKIGLEVILSHFHNFQRFLCKRVDQEKGREAE
jgi:hypothetical protein